MMKQSHEVCRSGRDRFQDVLHRGQSSKLIFHNAEAEGGEGHDDELVAQQIYTQQRGTEFQLPNDTPI